MEKIRFFVGALCIVLAAGQPTPVLSQYGAVTSTPPEGPGEKRNLEHIAKVKVLGTAKLEKLLNTRLNGALGMTSFGPFSNMFFVRSALDTGISIGLASDDESVTNSRLETAFPENYRPTLRELLDAIALQSKAKWDYDAKYQVLKSDKGATEPIENCVIFQFLPAERHLSFGLSPATGWKANEKTNWIMYVPPNAPMGMDLHICGKLSASSQADQSKLFASAPTDFALAMLRRARPDATEKDLKKTKVGAYDAIFFETQLPPTGEEKIRWRQWVFMVGDQLCFIVSTIPKVLDPQMLPDIEKMVKTFQAYTHN